MFNQFFVNLFSRLIFYKLKGEIHTFAQKCIHFCALLLSPPTRVAWIETPPGCAAAGAFYAVATHTGGVDRNPRFWCILYRTSVATHTGGVDRNAYISGRNMSAEQSPPTRVAWMAEQLLALCRHYESLSRSNGCRLLD